MARQAEALAKVVEHLGIAPSIPAWKAGVYLSTPMLEMKLESRKELHFLGGFADRCLGCSANGTKKGSSPIVQDCSGVIWPFFWKSMYSRAFPEEANWRSVASSSSRSSAGWLV